jgi:uncharacterized SAM-dependent methyltransferase
MSPAANVLIHPSQFPEAVRRDLLRSLRARQVNHKFHYDSVKQTQRWLALHRAFSPSRTDVDCAAIYDRSFDAVTAKLAAGRVHVVGLGCGGGGKDTRLLELVKARGHEVFYTPCDVSTAMVLTARQTALAIVPERNCFPIVCDLASADDLPAMLAEQGPADAARLITFFGMIPNFEPDIILPVLAALVRREDILLFSANLAPGADYSGGVKQILPQYDNPPTREWLMTFLLDLGVEPGDGELRFSVEGGPENAGLKRVVARFHFSRFRRIDVDADQFEFRPGESIRLFFSYRHTPALVQQLLAAQGLKVFEEQITRSGEEGVFWIGRP